MSSSKVLAWFDRYMLLVISVFLLAFIPLYPKIPLADIIPGYQVRVRLEDLLMLLAMIVWSIQLIRHKVTWRVSATALIVFYLTAGLISLVLGVFLLQSIPFELLHIGKSGIHLVRYFEYFLMFFFFLEAIKKPKDLKVVGGVLAIVILGVAIYGFGQKYLHWPLYSTMNREYSKGEALYLTEFARVQSTFAGHYDLAAYLVPVMPIPTSLACCLTER